jgi:tripartite-type tricarboxylate transporter receptor subunit TctC
MVARRSIIAAFAGAAIVVSAYTEAIPQIATDRPVTIIVPFTPGTGPDILARIIGQELQKRWKQTFVIENKPGATGNLGAQTVARAAPDGHTLMMTSNPFTANTSLLKNIPYDPVQSFTPVIYVGVAALALAVHPSIPVNSLAELIRYLKERPDQINYGSPGIGGPHHLAMELFKLRTGIEVRHIPYRGSAGALQDLIAGHVQMGFVPPHTSLQLAAQGQLRLLAVASKKRIEVAPKLPTFAEEGFPEIEVELWYALLAPAGTPSDVIARYNTAINEILRSPEIVEKLDKQGLIPAGGSPRELSDFIEHDIVKWRNVIAQAGISTE